MRKTFEIKNLISITFEEALKYYKKGILVECHIENEEGVVIEWEKYHLSDGLEIAVEFNEIINGKWYVDKTSKDAKISTNSTLPKRFAFSCNDSDLVYVCIPKNEKMCHVVWTDRYTKEVVNTGYDRNEIEEKIKSGIWTIISNLD